MKTFEHRVASDKLEIPPEYIFIRKYPSGASDQYLNYGNTHL